jgi:hypothetical protein
MRTQRSSSRRSAKPDSVQMTEPDAASDETAFVALRSRNLLHQHIARAHPMIAATFAWIIATIVVIFIKMVVRDFLPQ